MEFVQIIDYETDKPDEINAILMERRKNADPKTGPRRVTALKDRDNPRRYLSIIEFESYEEAMRNNELPETQKMAEQIAALCTRRTVFNNCDLLDRFDR